MSEKKIAVKVQDLTKTFKIPLEASNGLKQKLINTLKGRKGYREFSPLKGISFEIEEGDFFGIVGRNGSGKSTLLKSIAGIYAPEEGLVQVNGKLVPFIELGVGFNPELTGRENVFLNGALLGFSHKQMEKMYDDIVEFAELEDFMEERLKNYSSGMQVRLAFSIAIRAEGDVLLLDEVLAVGDEAFQRKCNEFFEKIRKDKSKTVILVTHDMGSVRRYCNKALLIKEGEVSLQGKPDKVASAYSNIFIKEQIKELEKKSEDRPEEETINKKISDVDMTDIYISQSGKKTRAVAFKEDFTLDIHFTAEKSHKNLVMGVHFFDQSGRNMLAISSRVFGSFSLDKGENVVSFDIQNILTDGDYHVNLAIEDEDTKKLLVQTHEVCKFSVIGLSATVHSKLGLTHPEVSMRYGKK